MRRLVFADDDSELFSMAGEEDEPIWFATLTSIERLSLRPLKW
jgi:hypothetical protein